MRLSLLLLSCFFVVHASGQKKIQSTASLQVVGAVKNPVTVGRSEILLQTVHAIGDLKVYNHKGEMKGIQKGLRGVLLTDVLKTVEFDSPSPRELSEFFFTIVASDGYRVVFSWNELFNSPTGDATYLVTEKDSVGLDRMEESILLVCATDRQTGRRNVKSVERIVVGRSN
jgi:hypothetical protein